MRDVPRTDFRPKCPRAHCCAGRGQFPEENEPPMQGCRVAVCCPPARSRKFRASGCGHVLQVMIPQLRRLSRHPLSSAAQQLRWKWTRGDMACASGKTLLVSYSSAKRSSQEGYSSIGDKI